jgi:hypothetical protein
MDGIRRAQEIPAGARCDIAFGACTQLEGKLLEDLYISERINNNIDFFKPLMVFI